MEPDAVLAFAAVAAIAFLYSAVGHAGASGYIATLTLLGFAPAFVRPTALLLNILVATIGTIQFARAGYFSWRLFWPFALLAVPAAFVGGALTIPAHLLRLVLAAVLLYSAIRLVVRKGDPQTVTPPRIPVALAVGTAIGFLSGITGTGGGIFLTPLLLFCLWAKTRTAAAISVTFILVNSIAGLAGYVSSGQPLPSHIWSLGVAAAVGGALGSTLGSSKLPVRAIYAFLAVVLTIAGAKLLMT